MILYTDDICGFLRWHGSVAPHALLWAIPSAGLAVAYNCFLEKYDMKTDGAPEAPQTTAWAFFSSILGFLVVFRAQLAYSRYWEGITLVEQACAVWLNGVSNLIAFCTENADKQIDVATFQHLLTRLMSLLFCESMADISKLDSSRFSCLDLEALDIDSLEYLETQEAKHAIVLQWVQRLVVENARTATIDIAPPILSRVFQEFSIGITHIVNANKLTTVPFPFQFAQMVWIMICVFSILFMPYVCGRYLPVLESALYTFVAVFTFWSVHYISVEIEQPFGEDPNDLPLEAISARFNRSLLALLEQRAQVTPQLVRATVEVSHHVSRVSQIGEDMMQCKRSQNRMFTEIRARLSKGSSRMDLPTIEESVGGHRRFMLKTMSKLSFLSRASETSEESCQASCQAAPNAAESTSSTRIAPSRGCLGPTDGVSEDRCSEVSEPSIFDQFLLDPSSRAVSGQSEPLATLPEAEAECSMSLSVTSSVPPDEGSEVSDAPMFDEFLLDPSSLAVSGQSEPLAPLPEAEAECCTSPSATSSTCLDEVEEVPWAPQRTNLPNFWSRGGSEDARVDDSTASCPLDQRLNVNSAFVIKAEGLPNGGRLAETGMKRSGSQRSCSPVSHGSGSSRHRMELSSADRSRFSSSSSREGQAGRMSGHEVNGSGNGSPFCSRDRSQFGSRESCDSRASRVTCHPAVAQVNGSGNCSPFCSRDRSQFGSLESCDSRASRVTCHPAVAQALSPKSLPTLSSLPMSETGLPLPPRLLHNTHVKRQAV